uniref:DNA helicase Pif1-like 2B domain-containing protein n=1 Tax=Octopus bimaculoides TaxID=37653 RepID=A0A0L8HNY4_OCTBM
MFKLEKEPVNKVFPNLSAQHRYYKWLSERAILAPKNVLVNAINFDLIMCLPGNCQSYRSIDTTVDQSKIVNYAVQFLNSLEPPILPPHKHDLKLGVPTMLLRNLDPPKLCRGVRLIVKKTMSHIIEATVLSEYGAGKNLFSTRTPLNLLIHQYNLKEYSFHLD